MDVPKPLMKIYKKFKKGQYISKNSSKPIYTPGNIAVVIIVCIVMICGSMFIANHIKSDIRQTAYDSMKNVSVESSKSVGNVLQSRIDYLNSVWIQLQKSQPDMRISTLTNQQLRSEIYGFDWVGCVGTDGKGINSLGEEIDLSNGDIFRQTIDGNVRISNRSITVYDGSEREASIISIPLYLNDNAPCGVLYQIFNQEILTNILEMGAFEGNASICLIESDGRIVTADSKCIFNIGDNITDKLLANKDNGLYVERLSQALKSPMEGGGMFSLNGSEWYTYYVPITVKSGGLSFTIGAMTTVPSMYIDRQISHIFNRVTALVLLIALAVLMLGIWQIRIQHKTKNALEMLAYMDVLTGESNYEAFKRDFEYLCHGGGVFIACDIVEFKLINRYYGSKAGDEALKAIGRYFGELTNDYVIAARISDDQFVLFFSDMKMEKAPVMCQKISSQIRDKLRYLGITHCNMVFGACYADGSETIERYRSKATFAKNHAKYVGDNYCAYDEDMASEYTETFHMLDEFEKALENKKFEVWYQPKYSVANDCICGAEALVRWRGDDGKMIPPGRFIPLLEERGIIDKLDEYMFKHVCMQQKKRTDEGLNIVPISVNVSRCSLLKPDIVQRYSKIIKRIGTDVSTIYLEITEDTVQDDVLDIVAEFRKEGFKLLMDDFGRGSSNLSSLRSDLFSGIKFDKSLIDLIGSSQRETILYHAMRMVQSMGMTITAEGVEAARQVDFLRVLGCEEIQGYYYYRPMDAMAFRDLIDSTSKSA